MSRIKTIKKEEEFREILGRGEKIRGTAGILFVLPDEELKFGIITSKKLGGAVARNRIKRRAREAFRIIAKECPRAGMVLIPGKNIIDASFATTVKNLLKMIGMANIGS